MIYTVTLNPAVDLVVRLATFTEGITNRAAGEELYFGGKGVNVSLVLRELGIESTALGFVAGFTGEALEKNLAERGVKTAFLHLSEGFTRINVKVKTEAGESEINGKGPAVPEWALYRLLKQLDDIHKGDTLVLAGSVPGSVPHDLYEAMIRRVEGRGIRLVVDAEGESLRIALRHYPFLVKPNRAELAGFAGEELTTEADILRAARTLQEAGAQNVLVSLGGEGALLLDDEGNAHRASAVGGPAVNTVGAGDSMVAGFLAGIDQGYDYALRLGLAAGGATAASHDLATRAEILRLMEA